MKRTLIALALVANLGAQEAPRKSMFVFQNSFWLNLHQFVRGEVYRRNAKITPGLDPATLDEKDRAAWTGALDAYEDLAKRNLIFDETLRGVANTLATVGNADRLPDAIVGASTTAALNAAAPIYRARIWPVRQRDNDLWIASATRLLEQHEAAMAPSVALAYQIPWPNQPILVDAVGECGPASAITHDGPPGFAAHTQASAASPRNTGDAPLELLIHEAAHADGVQDRIIAMIAGAAAKQKLQAPQDLWHAVIMFTSGTLAHRELARTGAEPYVPYAYRYNQYTPKERSALERDWGPYLDGKMSREEALEKLVRESQ